MNILYSLKDERINIFVYIITVWVRKCADMDNCAALSFQVSVAREQLLCARSLAWQRIVTRDVCESRDARWWWRQTWRPQKRFWMAAKPLPAYRWRTRYNPPSESQVGFAAKQIIMTQQLESSLLNTYQEGSACWEDFFKIPGAKKKVEQSKK